MNGSIRDTTVWKGTAFSDCDNNEIVLLHNQFERAAGRCNNGDILGRSIGVVNGSYISQLEVMVESGPDQLIMKDIKCFHDNGAIEMIIDSITINTSVICMSSEILNGSATNHTTTLKGNEHG